MLLEDFCSRGAPSHSPIAAYLLLVAKPGVLQNESGCRNFFDLAFRYFLVVLIVREAQRARVFFLAMKPGTVLWKAMG